MIIWGYKCSEAQCVRKRKSDAKGASFFRKKIKVEESTAGTINYEVQCSLTAPLERKREGELLYDEICYGCVALAIAS